jgi:hypothetical protein
MPRASRRARAGRRRAPVGGPRGRALAVLAAACLTACFLPADSVLYTAREVLAHPIEAWRLYRLMQGFESAAERKDPDAMAALVHVDAEHRGLTTGRLVRGRPALRQLFADELAGEAGSERLDTQLVSFRFVTPEVALGDLTIVYEDYRLGDRVWPVFREHTFVVLSKREGLWRIAETSAGGHDPVGAAP